MPHASSDNGRNELLVPLDRLTMLWCLASSIFLGIGGLIVYIYYLKKGQFEDPEDVKYQMFRDEENNKK